MILNVILQNELKNPTIPTQQQFQTWVDLVFKHVDTPIPSNVDEICLRIVDKKESAELNENFRQKTGPTNVLSFSNIAEHPDDNSLGDIAICAELVVSEAQELNIPIENHWAHLTVHAILHLLGYDHIEESDAIKMETLEIEILKTLNIENPYRGAL